MNDLDVIVDGGTLETAYGEAAAEARIRYGNQPWRIRAAWFRRVNGRSTFGFRLTADEPAAAVA